MSCCRWRSYQNNWLIARMGSPGTVSPDRIYDATKPTRGTYKILVHAILNLEDPMDEVILLVFEAPRILGIFYCSKNANHPSSCPPVSWAGMISTGLTKGLLETHQSTSDLCLGHYQMPCVSRGCWRSGHAGIDGRDESGCNLQLLRICFLSSRHSMRGKEGPCRQSQTYKRRREQV